MEPARRRTGLVPFLGHGSRLGTEELGLLAKLNERRCRYTLTLRAGEVTSGSVSELCQIPPETPVKDRELRDTLMHTTVAGSR